MKNWKKFICMFLSVVMIATTSYIPVMAGGECGYGSGEEGDDCEWWWCYNSSLHWTVCIRHEDENGESPYGLLPEPHEIVDGRCGCGYSVNSGSGEDGGDNGGDNSGGNESGEISDEELVAILTELLYISAELGVESMICSPSADGSAVTISVSQEALTSVAEEVGIPVVQIPEELAAGYEIALTIPASADLAYTGEAITPVVLKNELTGTVLEYFFEFGEIQYENNTEIGTATAVMEVYNTVDGTSFTLTKTFKITYGVEVPDIPIEFKDVSSNAYYFDAVAWAVEHGITQGTGEGTFSPNDDCTRAQIVTFLYRGEGEPEAAQITSPFTDVSSEQYYYAPVLWAVGKGITAGTSAAEFSPKGSCTRAQAVTFLYRLAGEPEAAGENTFADVDNNKYYADAITWAVREGITQGTGGGKFSPEATCTRAQIVTFLNRYYN